MTPGSSGTSPIHLPSSSRSISILSITAILYRFARENAGVEVVDDEPGQPLVVDKQALADRVGVLRRHRHPLLEDFVRPLAAVETGFDKPDPVLDNLRLLLEVGLATRRAVAGDDR